jgi:putative ABC transport system ATP-binding protein
MSLIELSGVTRTYEVGGGTVRALDRLDLMVSTGEFVVVLGPSGSGKTTLLNMIGGLDSPTSGVIVVDGRRISALSRSELFRFRRETVSFVFQTFNLFLALTALENVQFGADVAGRSDPREVATDALGDVGLGDRLHHFPSQLSGGEQQRVAIARALATGNAILLADEPTGELDFRTGIEILELLHAQSDHGITVIVVTHNREIGSIADRVVDLSSGRIISDSRPSRRVPIAELRW